MTIALIAHDSKKELMVQFCTAYCRILSQHKLVATGTTGKMIAEATGRLPEQQAKVVRLKGEGYSNEEISKELGISISTVKYHYNEALRRIREYVSVVVLFLMTGSLW